MLVLSSVFSRLISAVTLMCLLCEATRTRSSDTDSDEVVELVGSMPPFITAVKVCFLQDSVHCYEQVMKYFQDQRKVREAQLPALAAQLGAVHIFKHLKTEFQLTPDHPNWNKWMTRAAIREQWTFVKTFQGADKVPSDLEVSHDDEAKKRMNLYRINFGTSLFPDEDRIFSLRSLLMTRKKLEQATQVSWYSIPHSPTLSWLDISMVTDQEDFFPPVEQIRLALSYQDEARRIEHIRNLKGKITQVLSGGVYLMDDILPDPRIIISLWFHYDASENRYAPNIDFLEFLLEEGAPVHDAALIITPTQVLANTTGKSIPFCKSLQRLALDYASGSVKIALANELRYRTANADRDFPDDHFVERYHKFLKPVNILQPIVFRQLIPYLIKFPKDNETVQYFIDQGLDHRHTTEMYKMVGRLRLEPKTRREMNSKITMLWKKVHKRKVTRTHQILKFLWID